MVTLSRDYGYVVITGCASLLAMRYLSRKMNETRENYGVESPRMHSDDAETGEAFNRIQRNHLTTKEQFVPFLFNLTIGGATHPRLASTLGVVWIVSRVVSARACSNDNPALWHRGRFGMPAFLGLFFCCFDTAKILLGWSVPLPFFPLRFAFMGVRAVRGVSNIAH